MAGIERIVDVQISLDTASVARRSFDKLLLVGEITMDGRVIEITGADELLLTTSFGLTSTSPLYLAAQTAFSGIPAPSSVFIGRRGTSEEPATAMAAIKAENDRWYGFVDVTRDRTGDDHTDFAAWAEANEKLHLTAITPAEVATLGAAFKGGNFFRTAAWVASNPATQFPDVAAAVKGFSQLPGSETWANMTLAGAPSTLLTETEAQAALAQNVNTFEPFRNSVSITQGGKVAAGEWIDVIRFRDWLTEEIRTNVFDFLVDNRVPYTDAGIQAIGQQVRAALDLGVERGGIAPPEQALDGKSIVSSYTLTLPRSAGISPSQRASRRLTDVRFTARLAGAVHALEVRGTLTYLFA